MKKLISVNIDLSPDDIVDFISDADCIIQECILYKLSKLYYNHPAEFKKQLQNISDSIKEDYSHDTRNIIKYMIQDLNEYLGQ